MRYAWDRYQDYFNGWKTYAFQPFFRSLRQWDVTSSHRVDRFIANSRWTAKRIEKYYRRTAEVIYPFSDLEGFGVSDRKPEDYYLVVAGFAPYKRVDLAMEACQSLGRRLVIVGGGQENRKLRRLAKNTTEFLGRVSNEELAGIYSSAQALLFPGEEDFGITPLESMASGRPVIAFERGGVTESVVADETGVFFQEQSAEALSNAILRYESMRDTFEPSRLRARAAQFTKARFQTEIRHLDRELHSTATPTPAEKIDPHPEPLIPA
jgi:glycosyltransferase involved in cell wall biosynthesis